jgi:glycosyltransferase involved in cell wall biosynthesis
MVDVSVLIPAYNAELTIARAIRSCLNQPGVDVQVIVVDDGSTDDTTRRVNSFKQERGHFGVHYVYQKNAGLVAALRTAVQHAEGRYLIRLDADDWYAERSLKRMIAAMDAGAGFCYGQIRYYGRRSDTFTPPPFRVEDFYQHNASGYPVMYRREALDVINYETICATVPGLEDWDFNLALIKAGYQGLALRDTLVLHYILQHRSMMSVSKAGEGELMTAFRAKWPMVTSEVMP